MWVNQIPQISTWAISPNKYAPYAELTAPANNTSESVADTGIVQRAFLSYAAAENRQNLQFYLGKALVMDAWVSCQALNLIDFIWNGTATSEISGIVSPHIAAEELESLKSIEFSCIVPTYGQ